MAERGGGGGGGGGSSSGGGGGGRREARMRLSAPSRLPRLVARPARIAAGGQQGEAARRESFVPALPPPPVAAPPPPPLPASRPPLERSGDSDADASFPRIAHALRLRAQRLEREQVGAECAPVAGNPWEAVAPDSPAASLAARYELLSERRARQLFERRLLAWSLRAWRAATSKARARRAALRRALRIWLAQCSRSRAARDAAAVTVQRLARGFIVRARVQHRRVELERAAAARRRATLLPLQRAWRAWLQELRRRQRWRSRLKQLLRPFRLGRPRSLAAVGRGFDRRAWFAREGKFGLACEYHRWRLLVAAFAKWVALPLARGEEEAGDGARA